MTSLVRRVLGFFGDSRGVAVHPATASAMEFAEAVSRNAREAVEQARVTIAALRSDSEGVLDVDKITLSVQPSRWFRDPGGFLWSPTPLPVEFISDEENMLSFAAPAGARLSRQRHSSYQRFRVGKGELRDRVTGSVFGETTHCFEIPSGVEHEIEALTDCWGVIICRPPWRPTYL